MENLSFKITFSLKDHIILVLVEIKPLHTSIFYTFISKQHKSVWHFSKQTTTMEKKRTWIFTIELYKYDIMTYKKDKNKTEIHS